MFYSQNIEWHISQAIDIHLSLSIYNTRMMKIFTFLKQKMLAMKACFIISYKINNQKHNKKKNTAKRNKKPLVYGTADMTSRKKNSD